MQNEPKNKPLISPLLTATLLVLGTVGMLYFSGEPSSSPAQSTTKWQSILELIEDNYVDTVDEEQLIEGAIDGMVKKLDPHSVYIPARDINSVNEQLEGQFGGVGIRFLIHEDTLVATYVLEDAPSQRAGMQAGDRIVAIDDTAITGDLLTNQEVMDRLKGLEGTTVKVDVLRKGVAQSLTIVRGAIPVSSIDAAIMLNERVGLIKLRSFTYHAAAEFHTAAASLKAKGMEQLILDLRNNGGGLLHAAHEIADQFLPSGKLIVYTEGRKSPKKTYLSTRRGILKEVGVIVLINALSASASEIVAGAIQDNDRGLIMGRRSFGKGLVQDQRELADGSALRLTISRYYTPSGRSIQKPYGEGVDYDNDYYERHQRGELTNEDSVQYDASLKFTTSGGRTVYGGGGIYPDVFIPNDTTAASDYLTALYYKNAFNHYAIRYLDRKRDAFNRFGDFRRQFRVSDALFQDFAAYAEKWGVAPDPLISDATKNTVKRRIKAEIARHLWKDDAYYTIYLQDDKDVNQALSAFQVD